jgi:hypothetical protein
MPLTTLAPNSRRCRLKAPGRSLVVAVLFLAALLLGCGRPDASHYATLLDGLRIPAGWELVRTIIKAPSGGDIGCTPFATDDCPSVARYYLVAADSAAPIYAQGKDILTTAGFTIDREFFPTCNAPRSGPACTGLFKRNGDYADVAVFRPGEDAGSAVAAHAGAAIVVLSAHAD